MHQLGQTFGLPQNMVCLRGSLHQDSVFEKCYDTSKMYPTPDLVNDGYGF